MDTTHVIQVMGEAVEFAGVIVIVAGIVLATLRYVTGVYRARTLGQFQRYRVEIGRALLLGLEFLIAGDILRTVAIEPTFENLGVLGLLVVIRTFLSWTLALELEGRWPWQKANEAEA
jgi:uncharacterized membrane protein